MHGNRLQALPIMQEHVHFCGGHTPTHTHTPICNSVCRCKMLVHLWSRVHGIESLKTDVLVCNTLPTVIDEIALNT